MDLFLARLGCEERYALNREKDRFLIGRHKSCDIVFTSPHISRQHCEILRVPPHGTLIIKNLKGTNATYIDELELQNVGNFVELRIGCKIGLGVPLSVARGDALQDDRYVFLQLCDSQAERPSYNEEHQQTPVHSTSHPIELASSGPSAVGEASEPQNGPQRHSFVLQTRSQNQTKPSWCMASQPGPFRQDIQGLSSPHSQSKTNVPSDNAPKSWLQNADSRPFPSTPQSQVLPQLPPLQKLVPNTQNIHQSQNRIQEPLSELHLLDDNYEDLSHQDNQRLHNVKRTSSDLVCPNQMESLQLKKYESAPHASQMWKKIETCKPNQGHKLQSEFCIAQMDQQANGTSHGPHKRILSEEDHEESIPGKLQRQGAVYRQSQSADSLPNIQVIERSASGEHKQIKKSDDNPQHPEKVLNLPNESPSESSDPRAVVSDDSSRIQYLGNFQGNHCLQSTSPVHRSSAEKISHSLLEDDNQREESLASLHAQSASFLLTDSGSSRSSTRISCQLNPRPEHSETVSSLKEGLACSTRVSSQNRFYRPSGDKPPQKLILDKSQGKQTLQQRNDLLNTKTTKECKLAVKESVPEPKVSLNTEMNKSLGDTRRNSLTDSSAPLNVAFFSKDPYCKEIIDSLSVNSCHNPDASVLSDLSVKETAKKPEKHGDLFTVLTPKVSKPCTTGKNNIQSDKNPAAVCVISPQSSNKDSTECKQDIDVVDIDGPDSPVSIDLTQPDPDNIEMSENKRDDKIRSVRCNEVEHEDSNNNDDICVVSDSRSNSSSAEMKDLFGKRKRTRNEEMSVDGNDENSNKAQHTALLVPECGVHVDDSSNDSQSVVGHRKTKRRKAVVIDSDSSDESLSEPNNRTKSEVNPNKSSTFKPVSIRATVSECLHQKCVISVKKLPSSVIDSVNKGKVPNTDEQSNFSVQSTSETHLDSSENSASTSAQKYQFIFNNDDDELPDVNIPNVKKVSSHLPSPSGSSESQEFKKHIENKSRRKLKGIEGKDKEEGVKDSETYIPERRHRRSNSYEYTDNKNCKNGAEYKKQILCQTRDSTEQESPSTLGTEKNIPSSNQGYSKSHNVLSHTSTDIDKTSRIMSAPSTGRKGNGSKCNQVSGRTSNEKDMASDEIPCCVSVKPKLLPGVTVKEEKVEVDMKEIKIKEEKVEENESNGVQVKKELDQNLKSVDDVDNDDDVIFMYSQVDETIWVSSDEEEESPSQNDVSFGPLPSSPNLDIDELFREDEEQKLRQDGAGCSTNSTQQEVEADDQWFPVLSQSFFDDDDIDIQPVESTGDTQQKVEADDQWFPDLSQSFFDDDDFDVHPVESTKDSELPEPVPGPSKISEVAEDDVNTREWWPKLSQGFFDDDNDIEMLDGASKGDQMPSVGSKNLDAVIEKLVRNDTRRSQLTDPKMPPLRTKADNLRIKGKRQQEISRRHSQEQEDKVLDNDDRRDTIMLKDKWTSRDKKSKRESSKKGVVTSPQKRKQRKRSHLRENLTSKFNLESYKATVEHKPREKHHLVPKVKSEDKKAKAQDKMKTEEKKKQNYHKKSHLVTDQVRAGENISIIKKDERKDTKNQEKPRPKVAVKVTRRTRSERLTDVDLFSAPVPAPKAQKPKYKIPKSSDKNVDKMLGSLLDNPSTASPIGGSSSVLVKPSVGTLNTKPTPRVEPPMQVVSENVDKGITVASSPLVIKEQIASSSEQVQRSILRMDLTRDSTHKKVHFPTKLENLVQTLYISPRKNQDRLGILEVKAREVLPKEVLLQKYNISPNYMEQFIHHICRWNYDWLEVYRAGQVKQEACGKGGALRPPPVVPSTNYPTLILYNSYHDYKEIFCNLMYLEIWESVYQDWLKYRQSNVWLPTQVDVIHPAFIETGTGPLKFWTVKMFTLITQDQSMKGLHPRQGCLISLRIQQGAKRHHIFGHVDHFLKNRRGMVTKELQQACPYGEVCLMIGVRVTKEVIQKASSGRIIMISNVSYIRPSARTWEGLCKLPLSPLCDDILRPSESVFMCDSTCSQYLVDGMPLNDTQKKAVLEVSDNCTSNPLIPKMSLIHGPPGTGKTRTITALVAQIVKLSNEKSLPIRRILLCAPSNAAVDELTLRLIRLREIGICLRVVRVGVRESLNPEIKSFTLDAFVQKQIKLELSTPKNLSTKQEWERRKTMVEEAAVHLQDAIKENRNKEDIKQMEIRLTELARSKSEFEKCFRSQPTAQERHQLHQKWQQKILLNAEVITTTLGGCLSGVMGDVFLKTPNNFTCCIIDEAGQCKETETWLPLLLGVRKLVLVGDHRQLPATVLSRLAQDKNLKQSLFERLYHRFVIELQLHNLVHTLTTQYRMHPEIAAWPSQHFYSGRLITSPSIVQERTCDLKPYLVFDLKTSQELRDQNNELYNPAEALLVRQIIETLEPLVGKQKIGVITPYQRQKIHLEEKLAKFFCRMSLVVNTIDAFQGQERDFIILSFVRANSAANIGFLSHRQRLNVALTRARKSCYIVASLSSLSGNDNWQSLIKNAESRGLVHVITEREEKNKNYLRSILQK